VTASGSAIGGGDEWLAPSGRKTTSANRNPFGNALAIEISSESNDRGVMTIDMWRGTIEVLRRAEEIPEKP
jgi:hypothetical protein